MDRRDAITKVSSILALATLSGKVLAQDAPHDHMHMHDNPYQSLADTTAECVSKGQACLNHCVQLLSQGDKEMADCAKSVNQMLALCGALENLSNQQSLYTPAVARVALDACQHCENECRKHEKIHAVCKACAESCAACARSCKSFSA